MPLFIGYSVCFAATLVVIAGDYCLKLAADRDLAAHSVLAVAGSLLYAASGIGWYVVLRNLTLAQMGFRLPHFHCWPR